MLPVKLNLENFFSHRKSTVDFSEFESVLLLGNTEGDYAKSNGSGKSAVFEAILWCLFNKSRASMMDDIVLWGETYCSVTFDFSKLGGSYRVKRSRNKINSTSLVELYRMNEKDEWQNISCSTSGDTSKKIEEIAGLDYKTFINSIYFRQNDISEFAESEPSKRKEILKSIIDVSKWDEYEREAKSEIRNINTECKILEARSDGLEEDQESLELLKVSLDSAQDSLRVKNKRIETLRSAVEKINIEYSNMKKSIDTDSYDKIVDEINKLKNDGKLLSQKLASVAESLSSIDLEFLEVESSLLNKNKEIKDIEINEKDQELLDDINKNILKQRTQNSILKEKLDAIESLKEDEESCYSCGQDVSRELRAEITERNKALLSSYGESIKEGLGALKELSEKKTECKQNILNISKVNRIKDSIPSIEREFNIVKSRKSSLEMDRKTIISDLNSIKNKIKIDEDSLLMLKNDDFKALREKGKSLKAEYSKLSSEVSNENQSIGALKEKISTTQELLDSKLKNREELLDKNKRVHIFEKLCRFFGKNGIQTILLDAVIEDLEKSANEILLSICNEPSSIMLDTQRVGSDGVSIIETLDLRVRRDGIVQNFKSLSGGEQFRISLALRIALSEISSRHGGSSLEMLMLDEINSPLDKHGTDTLFLSVIKSLESKYKILIITHDDSLKEKFENILNITKINGESTVDFISR